MAAEVGVGGRSKHAGKQMDGENAWDVHLQHVTENTLTQSGLINKALNLLNIFWKQDTIIVGWIR
jgi:hypothetical protein